MIRNLALCFALIALATPFAWAEEGSTTAPAGNARNEITFQWQRSGGLGR